MDALGGHIACFPPYVPKLCYAQNHDARNTLGIHVPPDGGVSSNGLLTFCCVLYVPKLFPAVARYSVQVRNGTVAASRVNGPISSVQKDCTEYNGGTDPLLGDSCSAGTGWLSLK